MSDRPDLSALAQAWLVRAQGHSRVPHENSLGEELKRIYELGVAHAIEAVHGNPVKDAKAGPLPPDVATEQCDKAGTYGAGSYLFAVHAYPGKSAQDLTAVRALGHFTATNPFVVGGVTYDYGTPSPVIHDGTVAVLCGSAGSLTFDSVTFILPQ